MFRWDVAAGTSFLLPPGPTEGIDDVYQLNNGTVLPTRRPSVSSDGKVVAGVGEARTDTGVLVDFLWPFVWTDTDVSWSPTPGTSDLPQEAFGNTRFSNLVVAGDGETVVGEVLTLFGNLEGATWSPTIGPPGGIGQELGPPNSSASAVSRDGNEIGGWRPDFGFGFGLAYRWDRILSTLLGTTFDLDSIVRPRALSDDGDILTGVNFQPPPPFLPAPEPWIDIFTTDVGESLFTFFRDRYGISGLPAVSPAVDPLGLVNGDGTVYSQAGSKWVTKVAPVNFVSFGDSFSSGEGIPLFVDGTDDSDNRCHRSLAAYATGVRPRTSTISLRSLSDPMDGQLGFTWDFLACSGAETANVRETVPFPENPPGPIQSGSGQYPGSVVDGIDHGLPQITQAKSLGVLDEETDLATITIGGNDAQFLDVAKFCFRRSDCFDQPFRGEPNLRDWFSNHLRNNVKPALVDTFSELKSAAANATIIALGYPMLFGGDPCVEAIGFDEDEFNDIRKATNDLNQIISEAAAEAGIHDLHVAQDFQTHEVCGSADSWINPIASLFNKEYNLHPNAAGQIAYARRIWAFLNEQSIDYAEGFFASGFPRNPPAVLPSP